jgi:hypothetical protein
MGNGELNAFLKSEIKSEMDVNKKSDDERRFFCAPERS